MVFLILMPACHPAVLLIGFRCCAPTLVYNTLHERVESAAPVTASPAGCLPVVFVLAASTTLIKKEPFINTVKLNNSFYLFLKTKLKATYSIKNKTLNIK